MNVLSGHLQMVGLSRSLRRQHSQRVVANFTRSCVVLIRLHMNNSKSKLIFAIVYCRTHSQQTVAQSEGTLLRNEQDVWST